ncbi:hypothetical protein SAY87_023815 [Trapa incisa]|uniref:TOG domain-containing protein n=1 Tax=Trapa incisa TaxID=236973 RepID=A0AAN7L195_9MYRT|nr:hypothetical protein SAY87_023815 [Trapa incisa]
MEGEQLNDLFEGLLKSSSSSSWSARHGSLLTISSILRHKFSALTGSPSFTLIVDFLKSGLRDEKFPIRETSTKALGRLLLYQVQTSYNINSKHADLISAIISVLRDDSSEVRRRALSAIKSVAKGNPSIIAANISVVGPAVSECLKDGSTPVKLAAERCLLHVFQLSRAPENVQGAQKFITGLDARRISKLPEQRYLNSTPSNGMETFRNSYSKDGVSHKRNLTLVHGSCSDESDDSEDDSASG